MSKTIDNSKNRFRDNLEKLLQGTNIAFNGNNPWDIRVYNANLYERILAQGSLGLGEAYMDGWWDSDRLDELFHKICLSQLEDRVVVDPKTLFNRILGIVSNRQSKQLAPDLIKWHYDIGNDLYRAMLDKRMTYSCAYWKEADTLEQAQEHKRCEAGSRVVPRSDRACVFTKRCLRSENAGFTKSRRVIAQQVLYPWLGIKREEQDGWGAEGKSGRVKFLPLAWAGMPKTSFRKNSDSPIRSDMPQTASATRPKNS